MALIILIGLICIIGVVIGGIIYLEKYKEDVKFVCDTMDPDNILTHDECRQVIEQTKGAWGSAVNNAVRAKTTDEYLLSKCIELALITSVSKAECYAYMEKKSWLNWKPNFGWDFRAT